MVSVDLGAAIVQKEIEDKDEPGSDNRLFVFSVETNPEV